MPGVLPPVGELTALRNKIEKRKVQEMFCPALVVRNAIVNIVASSGLIKVMTSGVHNLADGDKVILDGVGGTVEANGFWTVTVTSTNEFTLDGSTHTNAFTTGGWVCDGLSYAIVCASAPASPGILVVSDVKMFEGGAFVDIEPTLKQITSTTETEFMRSIANTTLALALLTLTNNSAGSITGSLKIRGTKKFGNIAQPRVPFVLAAGHSLVVGGDGVRSKYDAAGLPIVS